MAISGDLIRVSATLPLCHSHSQFPLRTSSFPFPKVDFHGYLNGASSISEFAPKYSSLTIVRRNMHGYYKPVCGVTGGAKFSSKPVSQEAESFLLDAVNMSFFERLNLAWKIIFPSAVSRKSSNARIAKQRLKMILFSDRCAISDEAKQKIVSNVVRALSDFVEIESQDKVQLSVSADTDLGTIYSVTVPVRRVKPEYQDADELGMITNVEYKDTGVSSGSVDVTFDFFVPDEMS
ncbi:PREDICTED: cell division topological specificity factor homolog, chloroplastic [Lupinus angustifolius]|nr:PREDICTED: cell division topological specificity factor homolog, chloroplastic [Lupinus angustifolius]